jgi:hypothetical protein
LIGFDDTKASAQPYIAEEVKQETTMRKIIFTIVGAALIASTMSQVAFSKERHHAYNGRQFNAEQFRNSNAYAVPSYVPDAGYAGSGLAGAWGSMTGFN